MAIDRDATLKRAEKFLRQGKLEGAIDEYVRLVEDQPRDWNAVNALGDLYVRAGDLERAVAQFSRIGEHLLGEGFLPRASAVFKKALKTQPDHEPTLLRLAEIAERQGLIADARIHLRQIAQRRRMRGDERGAAECVVRLGLLEDADADTRMAAAAAARQLGDAGLAAGLLRNAAETLEKQGRAAEATDARVQAAQLDPHAAAEDPAVLLALARAEITAGRDAIARQTLTRMLTIAPDRHGDVVALAEELAGGGEVERAWGCVDVATDAALLGGDWNAAIGSLQAFVQRAAHVPALIKLVEICVDVGRDAELRDAQERLADAYLATGQGTEARVIAEDLFDQDPDSEEHARRLLEVLRCLGVEEPERVVTERRRGDEADPLLDAPELADLTADEASAPGPAIGGAPGDGWTEENDAAAAPIVLDAIEIDLSKELADIGAADPAPPPSEPPAADGSPRDLEDVFEDLRTRVSRDQQLADATRQYEAGVRYLDDGRPDEALAPLQAAARVPMLRFKAGAALGRLYIGQGDLSTGIEWLERAAEAPPPTPDEGFALMYELADVLELLGESARALAILMELDADAGGYRDVPSRIERLTRVQAGSHGR